MKSEPRLEKQELPRSPQECAAAQENPGLPVPSPFCLTLEGKDLSQEQSQQEALVPAETPSLQHALREGAPPSRLAGFSLP